MKKLLTVTFVIFLLMGCAHDQDFPYQHKNPLRDQITQISIGMNKDQVIEIMGEPKSVLANTENEYLMYGRYFVRFTSGKVDAYGDKSELKRMKKKYLDEQ